MKRILIGIAAFAAATSLSTLSSGTAGAVDEHAPHGGPGSHPHHVHSADGSCHDHPVRMEGGARGMHRGAAESGPDHGMWHGSCESHDHS